MFDVLFDLTKDKHIRHNGLTGIGCDCSYCRALHAYSSSKVLFRRFKHHLNREDRHGRTLGYPDGPDYTLKSDIESRLFSIAALRACKNHFKTEPTLP